MDLGGFQADEIWGNPLRGKKVAFPEGWGESEGGGSVRGGNSNQLTIQNMKSHAEFRTKFCSFLHCFYGFFCVFHQLQPTALRQTKRSFFLLMYWVISKRLTVYAKKKLSRLRSKSCNTHREKPNLLCCQKIRELSFVKIFRYRKREQFVSVSREH